ncbi:MAG: hypothetical protein MSG64_07670 [Pyrinomonadaceae bacterium MAG19_C2-C3]|nr:hypothetical protein [Pyrinomonadaceae bacterium MAG19_C2-C3]
MSEKRSKYDTDPLDPDFVRGTEHIGGATTHLETAAGEQPRSFPYADAPTQRYANATPQGGAPEFRTTTQPPPSSASNPYQDSFNTVPSSLPTMNPQAPHTRTVSGTGLPENALITAVYAPLFIGVIPALAELLLVPRTEHRVRFHAAQALALHIGIFALGFLLRFVGGLASFALGGFGSFLSGLTTILLAVGSFIFLVMLMTRAWNGTIAPIELLTAAARWLNQKIEPQR